MQDVANIWMWVGFSVFLVFALSVDTFILGNKTARPHESMRAALFWTLIWVASALIFNVLLWVYLYFQIDPHYANGKALDFLTGYLIEKSLSIDNLFVFFMIFNHFKLSAPQQRRVLAIGIWSAVIMRLGLILLGTWLVTQFHWLLYVMGVFLLLTGLKMLVVKEKEKDLVETSLYKVIKYFVRIAPEVQGQQFYIRKEGLLYFTPLFIALIFVEISDLIFAFDSIPAIFAITRDPFIVWTSNIFAILGLRALYFLLASVAERFHLLKYGIALILVFVGAKMTLEPWVAIPVQASLAVIASILLLFAFLSYREQRSR